MSSPVIRRLGRTIPSRLRARLRIIQHNLVATGSNDLVHLEARRESGHWAIGDGDRRLRIPSIERWWRYDRGIEHGCARVADVYRLGQEVAIRPGDVVIDVGANIGEVSLYCAARGAVVFSVEAEPLTFGLLIMNTASIDTIHPRQFAVSDRSGSTTLYQASSSADSSIIESETFTSRVDVMAITLDEFAEAEGLGAVHLIKCDAEGAEPEVLRGATDVLTRTTWVSLDCSAERRGEATVQACRAALETHGFSVREFIATGDRLMVLGHRGAWPTEPGLSGRKQATHGSTA